MPPLPGTTTVLAQGLGKTYPSEDGTSGLILSGVAVAGQFALGDVLGPFLSPEDAEAKGIDAAYDQTNTTIAYKHIVDFYTTAPTGTKLYVMVVAKTQTLTTTCTPATALGLTKLVETVGDLRLTGLTFTPDGTYTPTFATGFEADLWSALVQLKLTHAAQTVLKRPFRVIIEGRNFQGTPSATLAMRAAGTTPGANMALVAIGNDWEYDAGAATYKGKYASVGYMLGCAAAVKVNRNIGRVKNGPTAITIPGLSNGVQLTTLTNAQWNLLHDNGFVFFRTHANKAGVFISDDPMACVSTDDFSQLTLGRTMDKAVRICHRVNTDEILDEIAINVDTGKIDVATLGNYKGILETALDAEMTSNQEIMRGTVTIDPAQNVLATSKVEEVLKIIPTGTLREIRTTLQYTNILAKP